jgi:hypothetical protein
MTEKLSIKQYRQEMGIQPNAPTSVPSRRRYTVGVDPGQNVGVAIYDTFERRIIETRTLTPGEFILWVWDVSTDAFQFVVEDCRLIKITGRRKEGETGVNDRKGQNVGMVKGVTGVIIEFLQLRGFAVVGVRPRRKKDADQLKRETGIETRTNQHVRDAIDLCWGINVVKGSV